MNKKELIDKANQTTGHTRVLIEEIWDEMQRLIAEELANGEIVSISGFGRFSTVVKPEKERLNHFTKERITVPAKVEPKFKFADVFKAQVNRN